MFKNPEYNAVKVVGLVAVIAVAGYFTYTNFNSGNLAQVIKLPTIPVSSGSEIRCPSGTKTPSIALLSPNGGETYTVGQQVTIKWGTCYSRTSDNVYISLSAITPAFPGGVALNTLAASVPNTGQYTVTLPTSLSYGTTTIPFGTYFKVYIQQANQTPTYWDYSDNLFTILQANTGISCVKSSAYSDTNISPNTNNAKIGSFSCVNLTQEPLRVSAMYVSLSAFSIPITNVTNLRTSAVSGYTTIPIPKPSPGNTVNFNGSTAIIPANSSQVVDVFGDIGSAPSDKIQTMLNLSQGFAVGMQTNHNYITSGAWGQTITVK